MTGKTLVAGIGNVFLGDDGFGVEVATRLAEEPLREGVRVMDVGIRARDLAYELLDGAYDTLILIDAAPRGGTPGTVYLIEPHDIDRATSAHPVDGHAMDVATMLAFVQNWGRGARAIFVVGCEPESIEERLGLSPSVAAGVHDALALVRTLVCA